MVIGILQFLIDIQAMVYPATLRKPREHEAQDDMPRKNWTYCLASFRRSSISGIESYKAFTCF